MTTTAVSSVSAHPPTVLVCVDLGSRTLTALRARRKFVVNFIGQGRSQLCLLFASKADDKFEKVSWRLTRSGLPMLHEDVLAWAECSTVHDLEVGDHVILVAQVETGGVTPELESPLMCYPAILGRVVSRAGAERAGARGHSRDGGERARSAVAGRRALRS